MKKSNGVELEELVFKIQKKIMYQVGYFKFLAEDRFLSLISCVFLYHTWF